MILFEKETKVVTIEPVEVPNGIYYFSYITEQSLNGYYKITVNEHSFDRLMVVLDEEETAIKMTVNNWDVDYYAKRLFQGDEGVSKISEEEFNLKLKEAMKIISTQLSEQLNYSR